LSVSIEPLFSYVKISHALLIAAAPPLLWAGRFIKKPATRPLVRNGLRLLLPALPVLLALGLALAQAYTDFQSTGGTSDYDY
jgi:hypothetical protein